MTTGLRTAGQSDVAFGNSSPPDHHEQPGAHARPSARVRANPPRQRRAGLARWRTTPGRVRALTVATVLPAIALPLVVALIFGGVAGGFTLIGQQAGPEVETSTDLYFRLNDMDAQVANVLLVGSRQGLGIDRKQAQAIYQQDRAQADADLQRAAVVASALPAAQRAVRSVLDGLGNYEALTAQAIYLDENGVGSGIPGRPPATALGLYRQATDLLRGSLLPAADSLTSSYSAALDSAYQVKRSSAQAGIWWLLLLGVVLLGALAGSQLYLATRYRRLINPALALASVIALILVGSGVAVLSAEAGHLKVAKQDAFDSILALSRARAISYDGNADESRYLVDPARAGQYQQAFSDKSQQLLSLNGTGISSYDAALASAISAYHANNSDVRFGGYFGTEFRNITFAGERAAAERTLAAYQVYQRDDRKIRSLNAAGNLDGAIAFDTSYAAGNSNWAFSQYDNSLVALIGINQKAFNAAIGAGQHAAAGWNNYLPAGAAVLMVGLILIGIRPRLSEYR